MLFNSFSFLLFFLIFFIIYRRLSHNKQNILLLLGGIYFYSTWNVKFLILLFGCIILNFYGGRFLSKNLESKNRKLIFSILIILNVSILVIFKYTGFILSSLNDFLLYFRKGSILLPEILLPLGISFFTFHNISYIFDIYNKKVSPAKSFLSFSIFDMFFPLLLAGPIERADSLIPQIENKRLLTTRKITSGVSLFLIGIFKKVLIADNLSIFTEKAMDSSTILFPGITMWMAFVMAFQVYADFSGYSDCARGLAKIMGFELRLNFFHPYTSTNPVDFWKRWHISLSSWLKDYLYIPLGGNRFGKIREYLNLTIVWTLGGLWHGATYGYLIWGLYCGIQVVLFHIIKSKVLTVYETINRVNIINMIINNIKKLKFFFIPFFIKWIARLGVIISFGMGLLLFKINGLSHINYLWENLFGFYWNMEFFFKIIILLFPLIIIEIYQIKTKDEDFKLITKRNPIILFILAIIYIQFFLLFGAEESKEFFYFQF